LFYLDDAFFVLIYWLPVWFQAINNVSAFESGIRSLFMVLSLVIASIISGIGTTVVSYSIPFYYLSVIISAVSTSLLTTLQVITGHGKWVGY